jgi:hypothetical protein
MIANAIRADVRWSGTGPTLRARYPLTATPCDPLQVSSQTRIKVLG